MRYQLFYQQHPIAAVEETNSEFPSYFGHYRLEPTADVPELAHVRAYIDFCVRVSPLWEQERFNDPALLEEETFTDLIDSPDWSLVEITTQQRIPILIPMFFTDNGMTWRLNP